MGIPTDFRWKSIERPLFFIEIPLGNDHVLVCIIIGGELEVSPC